MARFDQYSEESSVSVDDKILILDASTGQNKLVTQRNLVGVSDFGWTATGESWTYSSYNSTTKLGVITVPAGALTKYAEGMAVRFSQTTGGTKYARIRDITSTTLTVVMAGAATLSNEAMSDPVYSSLYSPQGMPDADGAVTNAKLASEPGEIGGSWTPWTPVWTSSGTAPSIGNGTLSGAYLKVGKTVYFRIKFVGGSTTTWGTGNYFITLPSPAYSGITANDGINLTGYGEDSGVNGYLVSGGRMFDTAKFYVLITNPTRAGVDAWAATAPFTWSTGDFWSATGVYEAA